MKPRDEANTASPANVQSAAPSMIPTASTAIQPMIPAWPNHGAILRARHAASDDPMITVAAQAAEGAATRGSGATSTRAWRATNAAAPITTTVAKNPSGSNRTSSDRRLATNQRNAKIAAVYRAEVAFRGAGERASAGSAHAT